MVFEKSLVTNEEMPSLLNLLISCLLQIGYAKEIDEAYWWLESEWATLIILWAFSQAEFRPLLHGFDFILDLLNFQETIFCDQIFTIIRMN